MKSSRPRSQPRKWREYGRHGEKITYEVVESDPPSKLITRIADPHLPFGGTWTYQITPTAHGSTLTITENGEIYNPIFRFVSRYLQGYTATIDNYLKALHSQTRRFLKLRAGSGILPSGKRLLIYCCTRIRTATETIKEPGNVMLIILLVILLLLSVGIVSRLAVQSRLGLLSLERIGIGPGDPGDLVIARPDLMVRWQESLMTLQTGACLCGETVARY